MCGFDPDAGTTGCAGDDVLFARDDLNLSPTTLNADGSVTSFQQSGGETDDVQFGCRGFVVGRRTPVAGHDVLRSTTLAL